MTLPDAITANRAKRGAVRPAWRCPDPLAATLPRAPARAAAGRTAAGAARVGATRAGLHTGADAEPRDGARAG